MTRLINGYPIRGIPANLAAAKRLPGSLFYEFALKRTQAGFRDVHSRMLTTGSFMNWDAGFIPVGISDKIRTEEQFEDEIFAALEKQGYFYVTNPT